MEKKIIERVEDLYGLATAGTAAQRSKWVSNYKYWKGTNKIKRPSYKDSPRVPLIFRYINGIISIITYNSPKFDFRPQEKQDVPLADLYNQVLGDYYWDKLKLSEVSEDLIWYAAAISGSGMLSWGIDKGTGEYFIKVLNSFCCFPDPGAKDLDSMNFFIYNSMWSLNDIKMMYPERGQEVKEQTELNELKFDSEEILSPWARSSGKQENLIKVLDKEDFKKDYGRAMVKEIWEKDVSREPIPIDSDQIYEEHDLIRLGQLPQVDENNNHPEHIRAHKELADNMSYNDDVPPEYMEMLIAHIEEHIQHPDAEKTERLKYPRGKRTVIAGNTVLEEPRPAPFGLALAKMDFIRNPLSFWGQTVGEYAKSLQDSRERRKRQISDHADRCANPREFSLINSGYDPAKVKNVAGEQVQLLIPNSVWWEQTPQLNNYLFEDMIDSERTVEKLMSFPDVMQGQKPPGDTSGVLVAELKESLAPEMAKATRHFEWAIAAAARGLVEMVQETESPTRVYMITGQKGNSLQVNRDQLNLAGEYDLRIKPGSSLPTSRQAKEAKALQYYQAGLYTRRAALEYSDDPQAQDVLEEFAEINMLQNQNQELEQHIETLNEIVKNQQKELVKNGKELEKSKERERAASERRTNQKTD